MYSVLFAVYAKEGMTPEDFTDHWVNVHGTIGKRIPHVVRYEMFPVTRAEGELGEAIAGFAVVQYENEAGFQAAGGSDAMQEAVADAGNFARHFAVYNVSAHTIQ